MFRKLVAIEPINLVPAAKEKLRQYAETVILYDSLPQDEAEIIRRIDDADAVLLSYTSRLEKPAIEACPALRYIGMCCSLYSEQSANVDIRSARERGVVVTGVRDYGDQGVVEYVISELVRYLHGFGAKRWQEQPVELTGLRVGIVGLGVSGQLIAAGLQALGAELYYFSRSRKPEQEARGIRYLPLPQLLPRVDVVCCCLNKNVILLGEQQFEWLGNHKILFNTSIGPSHDLAALEQWLAHGDNEFFCDSAAALGDSSGALLHHPHVNCLHRSAGLTRQALERLSEKALKNICDYLETERRESGA